MTNESSKLSDADFKYLIDILNDEEERQYVNIEIRDNLEVAKINLERLTRIRLALVDLKDE